MKRSLWAQNQGYERKGQNTAKQNGIPFCFKSERLIFVLSNRTILLNIIYKIYKLRRAFFTLQFEILDAIVVTRLIGIPIVRCSSDDTQDIQENQACEV